MTRSIKFFCFAQTCIIVALLSGWHISFREHLSTLFEFTQPNAVPLTGSSPSAWFRPLPKEEVDHQLRLKRAAEDSEKYFNPERLPDAEYQQKLRRHYAIARYLTATRRHSLPYRKIMSMLLVRGYGVLEWLPTCSAILDSQLYLHFQDPSGQHENSSEVVNWPMRESYDFYAVEFAKIFGLVDHDFFQSLLAVRLDTRKHEPVLGLPLPEVELGDRFLTDQDWLTPHWTTLQSQYEGAPRAQWTKELRETFAGFYHRSIVRKSTPSIPEDSSIVAALMAAKMITSSDLEGVVITEARASSPIADRSENL